MHEQGSDPINAMGDTNPTGYVESSELLNSIFSVIGEYVKRFKKQRGGGSKLVKGIFLAAEQPLC